MNLWSWRKLDHYADIQSDISQQEVIKNRSGKLS